MRADISYGSVAGVLGRLLLAEALLLLIPLAVALEGDAADLRGFLWAVGGSAAAGTALSALRRGRRPSIHRREGFMLVSLAWVVCSAFGMIPFILGAHPLSVTDAFFETISGFTTTGATTIADVEALSPALLLWRSMTQWIGGLGILLFMLAVLPTLNEKGGIPIYNAETTGISHSKIHPRIRQTALALWSVYIVLTVAMLLLLWAGPMDFFDALNHSLCAISTGGFSTRNAGVAYWNSQYVDAVLTVFMFAGGVNFALLYDMGKGRFRNVWKNDVLRAYCLIVLVAYVSFVVALVLQGKVHGVFDAVTAPLFHAVSAVTSTGFSISDYSGWGPFALLLTMLLMASGACAGSTSGGLKVDRTVALRKNIANEVKHSLYTKRMYVVRVNGQVIPGEELSRITAFVTIYVLLIVAGALVASAFGIGLEDAFYATISCIGNNGLGYGVTGVAGGVGMLPDAVKWIMSLIMLLGRLEIFSVIVMVMPVFWRK